MADPLSGAAASSKIDELLAGLDGDWRGHVLGKIRALFHNALPDVVEEWKWLGSPVWSQNGILAVGNAHKAKVKLTFPHGAELDDPDHVFNAGLGGKAWRAIDLAEGDMVPGAEFKALVRRAADYNSERAAKK